MMNCRLSAFLFCVMMASAAPLGAEESGNRVAEISAAFSTNNHSKALVLLREAFARLKPSQSVEAATLIKSVLASVPTEESGAVLVAAIQGNPSLGKAILNAAVSGASRAEQLVMLSQLSFAVNHDPESFSSISESVPSLINGVAGTVPASMALTLPAYNRANSLRDSGVFISPHEPDVREDREDINADREQLRDDLEQLQDDRQEHAGKEQLKDDRERIKDDRQDFRADQKDLRRDRLEERKDDHQAGAEERKDDHQAGAEERKDDHQAGAEERKDDHQAGAEERKDDHQAGAEERKDDHGGRIGNLKDDRQEGQKDDR